MTVINGWAFLSRVTFVIMTASCFCLMVTQGLAQDAVDVQPTVTASPQVQKLLAPIESMVGKNTYAIAHANLAMLDVDAAVSGWKELANTIASQIKADKDASRRLKEADIDIDDAIRSYFAEIDKEVPPLKDRLEKMMTAGAKEVYVVASSQTMMVVPVRFAIVVEKGKADAVLESFQLPPQALGNLYIEKSDEMLIINLISPMASLDLEKDSDLARIKRLLALAKPLERPELVAGFEKVKNAPVQVIFAPEGVLKGFLSMGLASAPDPVNKIKAKTINDGMKWVSLGVDPMRTIFAVTIKSESPEAAQEFYDTVVGVYRESIAMQMKDMPDAPEFAESTKLLFEKLETLFPKVKGDQLQLVLNKAFVEKESGAVISAASSIIPAVVAARDAARRMQCANNMKQIMLGVHTYHDATMSSPSAVTADKNGKPLHSWRVALLPYLEQSALYKKIRQNEPWDSEYNKQFHNQMPSVYRCPSAKGDQSGMTTYSFVVGKETVFKKPNSWNTFGAISDGTSNTICVVERAMSVCWMDPTQEITFEEACKGINVSENGIGSAHANGANFALFDGSVQFISENIDLAVLKALLTCAGGESNTGSY